MSDEIAVKVNFYGLLREIAGTKSEELLLKSKSSIGDLMKLLSRDYQMPFCDPGQINSKGNFEINIFVNHMAVSLDDVQINTLLGGDRIDLFVIGSGG
jgi:molybdopterin converting factor small subunit